MGVSSISSAHDPSATIASAFLVPAQSGVGPTLVAQEVPQGHFLLLLRTCEEYMLAADVLKLCRPCKRRGSVSALSDVVRVREANVPMIAVSKQRAVETARWPSIS
jgi:hypothetical protein